MNAKDGDHMIKHCSDTRSFCFGVKNNIGYFNTPKENSSAINDNGCISNHDCNILLIAYKSGRDKYMWSLSAMNDKNFTTKTELIISENKNIGDKYLSALMIRKYSNDQQWIIDAYSTYIGSEANCGQNSGCYEKISVSQDGAWSRAIFETSAFLTYDTYEVSLEKPLYVHLMQKIGRYDTIKYIASNMLSCYLFKDKDYSNSCSIEQRKQYEAPPTKAPPIASTATPSTSAKEAPSTRKSATQPITTQKLTTKPVTTSAPSTKSEVLVSNQPEDGAIDVSPNTTVGQTSESAITFNPIVLDDTSTTRPPVRKKNTTYIIIGVIAGILILIIIVGCLIYRYCIVPKQIRRQKTNYGRLVPCPFTLRKPNRLTTKSNQAPKSILSKSPKSAFRTEIIPNDPSKKGAKKLLSQGKSELSNISSVASMNKK